MSKKIIKGDDLMLFDSVGKSFAYATNHVLTIDASTTETNTKDHGIYSGVEVNKLSWNITSENLFTENAYDALFDAMIAKQAVKVWFGRKAQTDDTKTVVNDDYAFWSGSEAIGAEDGTNPTTAKTQQGYYGLAYITSLVANAPTGDNATYSVTLTGTGKIAKVNMPTVETVKYVSDGNPDNTPVFEN